MLRIDITYHKKNIQTKLLMVQSKLHIIPILKLFD